MTRARLDRDAAALLLLGALCALRFLPDALRGTAPFWGDMTYIHQPWRAFDAELVQAGRLPLWNPYLYFGMPQAAAMQDGLFYPGSIAFFLFGFPVAAMGFLAAHYWLGAALCFLLLRRAAGRTAALAGAALFSLSGLGLSREPFMNQLAVYSLIPSFVLFFGRPAALAAALAAAFLAGYPQFLAGGVVAAWVVALALGHGRLAPKLRGWTLAAPASAALSACLLFPALELTRLSKRSAGVDAGEALLFGFSPADLRQWLSPLAVPRFDPGVDWWKCVYLGFVGAGCAAAGLFALRRRRAAALAAWLAAVLVLILASSNPLSAALWRGAPPLRFIRYPGNVSYLALLPLAVLCAAGARRAGRLRVALTAALCAELTLLAWGAMPRAPRGLLTSTGPLARALQLTLDGHRYLMSPRALETHGGAGLADWRHRLYGLTNAPSKLRAGTNFGEPLVPCANYAVMDALLSARSAAEAAAFMPWVDAAALLTPEPVSVAGLEPAGTALWAVGRLRSAAGARLLSPAQGETLPASFQALNLMGKPLAVARPREDALEIRGEGAGWVYLAEPLYPGWRRWLETPLGPGEARALPALGAFQKISVPSSAWTLRLRYEPRSFLLGLWLTLLSTGVLAAYLYNRLLRA